MILIRGFTLSYFSERLGGARVKHVVVVVVVVEAANVVVVEAANVG